MNAYEFGAFVKLAIDPAAVESGYDRAGIAARMQHVRQLGQQAQQNGGQFSMRGDPAMSARFNNLNASAGGAGRSAMPAPTTSAPKTPVAPARPAPVVQPRPTPQQQLKPPMIQTRRESPDL